MTDRQKYYQQMEYLLVFFVTFLFLAFWQFHLAFGDPDVFYHAAIAQLLSEGVLLRSLPWMQFTTLSQHFTDHHLLYHLLLAPLMKLGNPLYAIKLGTILFGASFFTVFYWFLRRLAPQLALIWTALLLFSSTFAFRLALVKANSVSLIVVVLILYALLKKKIWLLFFLQIIYVWLYGGWIFGIMTVGLYWCVDVLAGWSSREKSLVCRLFRPRSFGLLVVTLAGSLAGIVLNPYWPHNLYFYWQQIVQIGVINYGQAVGVGAEWLSLSWRDVINFHVYPLVILAIIIIFGWHRFRQLRRDDWFLVILSFIAVGLTWKSRRYVELSDPLLFIATAVLWVRCLPQITARWLKQQLSLPGKFGWLIKFYAFLVIVFIIPTFIFLIFKDVMAVRANESQTTFTVNQLAAESQWLQENSRPGEIVFNSNWDYWPALFYYNRSNYYIVGLDPTFMYNQSPELWALWSSVSEGKATGDIAQIITKVFHSRFLLVGNGNHDLIDQLSQDKNFVLRYQGPFAKIFEIVKKYD
ncbi:MAG: hypothetical protein V1846_02950 [Candidatus Komeilibacteria bacterium]